jgi:hypothetical protein
VQSNEGRSCSSNRVIRGGNFNNNTSNLLPPNRNNNNPTNRNNNIGFRCAKTVGSSSAGTSRRSGGHGSAPRGASTVQRGLSCDSGVPGGANSATANAVGPPLPEPPLPVRGHAAGGGTYRRTKTSFASSLSQSVLVCP